MQTNELILELIDAINAYSVEGEAFEAIFAFDGRVSPVPIDRTYIAFSTSATSVDFFENENSESCKRTNVTISVDFYSSPKRRARDIYSLCESVMDRLMVDYAGRMTDYHAGELEIDDKLRLVKLPCSMRFTFEQCPAFAAGGDVIRPFADFMCKTHVADSVSHLTPGEKSFLGEPFVFGSYTGDGESSKSISLGFRPALVFVFKSAACPFGVVDGALKSFCAFSSGARATKGLSIGPEGFSVGSGSAFGVEAELNSIAQTYCYFALKTAPL